jgi:predicted transcriptional regulator
MEKTVKVGIISKEEFIARSIAIAKGEYKPAIDEPKMWFESIKSFAQLLGDENQELLQIIDEMEPNNMKQLVERTGRKASNLSRTLHSLEARGIIKLEKNGKEVKPVALATSFIVEINKPKRKIASVRARAKTNLSAISVRGVSVPCVLAAEKEFKAGKTLAKGAKVTMNKEAATSLKKKSCSKVI